MTYRAKHIESILPSSFSLPLPRHESPGCGNLSLTSNRIWQNSLYISCIKSKVSTKDDSKVNLSPVPIIPPTEKAPLTSTTLTKDAASTPSQTAGGETASPAAGNAADTTSTSAAIVKSAAAATAAASPQQRKVLIDLSSKTPALPEDTSVTAKLPDTVPVTLNASIVLEQSEKLLMKLLKVLHVCARYQRCSGKQLPDTIDFFGKTLLGMTSIRWGRTPVLPCSVLLCTVLLCPALLCPALLVLTCPDLSCSALSCLALLCRTILVTLTYTNSH